MTDNATIQLRADDAQLQQVLSRSQNKISSWASVAGGALAGLGVGLLVGKIVEYGKYAVKTAEEIEVSFKEIEQTLKNTGNAAGYTKAGIEEIGAEVQRLTQYDDDATRATANLFAKMGNIKGDIFKQAIFSAADLAASMKTSMPQAASTLARALADPERGMLMLRRSGVILTKQQEDMAKQFAETGQIAKAQEIILKAVNEKVGGQAAAQVDTFAGKWAQFSNRMGDVAEAIGFALFPAIEAVMPLIERTIKLIEILIVPLTKLIGWVFAGASAFMDWLIPLDDIQAAVESVTEYVTSLASVVMDWLEPAIRFVTLALQDITAALLETASSILNSMKPSVDGIIEALSEWAEWIWSYLKPAILWVAEGTLMAFTFAQTVIQNFSDTAIVVLETFALAFVIAFERIKYFLLEVIPAVLKWFGENWRNIFTDAWEFLKTILSNMWTNLKNFWDGIVGLFKGEGFDFKMTSLLEGFEATTKELPKIAERVKSELEKSLEGDIAKRGGTIADKYRENLEKNRKIISDLAKDAQKPREPGDRSQPKETKPLGTGLETPPPEQAADAGKGKGDKQGTIEDLLSMNKRITEAAAGKSEQDKLLEAQTKNAEDTIAAQDRTTEAVMDNTDALNRVADNTGKIAEQVPLAGVLSD